MKCSVNCVKKHINNCIKHLSETIPNEFKFVEINDGGSIIIDIDGELLESVKRQITSFKYILDFYACDVLAQPQDPPLDYMYVNVPVDRIDVNMQV